MMSRELLQQALDALVHHRNQTRPIHESNLAIEALQVALREALTVPDHWREAVLDRLAVLHMDAPLDEPPESILRRIIECEVMIALDPRVSSEAQALIDKGASQCAASIPLTDEQKQGLLHRVGIVTGANLTGMHGQRYRSLGTPYNVWEKDLYALIDAARVHADSGGSNG